jgi:hypothetical protein
VAAATGLMTRSRIEGFDQTASQLSGYATRWRAAGATLEHVATAYVGQVANPAGTEWSGQAATGALDAAHSDRVAVTSAVMHAHQMADTAELGSSSLLGARQGALEAIAQAEADDYTVGEDLSVADNHSHEDPVTYAARMAQAEAHLAYIEHHAGLLEAQNDRFATQLGAGAAQMSGMVPATWQPGKRGDPDDTIVRDPADTKPKFQMVGNGKGPLPADPAPTFPQPPPAPPQAGGPIRVPQRPNPPTVINAEPGVGGNLPAPPPPGFSGASGMTQLRDLALILGGTATIGLSIPGELVTGGAATVGIIGGGTMVIGGMTELIDGME